MSFILDALRKAETKNRDRHNLTVPKGPRVLTEELPEAPVERRPWIWLALLAVLAVGLVWWFLPTPTSTTTPASSAQVTNTQRQPSAAAQREPQRPTQNNEFPAERPNVQRETGARALEREAQRGLVPQAATSRAGQSAPTGSSSTRPTATTSQRVTPGTVTILEPDGSLPADTPASTAGTNRANSMANNSTNTPGNVTTEALPEYLTSLASGEVPIPRLHLDMHVFSAEPAKRFVFINLDKYGEGDAIDRDTTVESIEQNGAVINHKGYRFVLRPE